MQVFCSDILDALTKDFFSRKGGAMEEPSHVSEVKVSQTIKLRSAVRLRFRKSISGHHFQTIEKLASNDFNHHTEVVNSI